MYVQQSMKHFLYNSSYKYSEDAYVSDWAYGELSLNVETYNSVNYVQKLINRFKIMNLWPFLVIKHIGLLTGFKEIKHRFSSQYFFLRNKYFHHDIVNKTKGSWIFLTTMFE
jgi:hypothetical protein